MSKVSEEIFTAVNWLRVLEIVHREPTVTSLPHRMECLLCRGLHLLIQTDTLLGGQSCYCPDCDFSGTLLELVAKLWNLPVDITIMRLAGLGCKIPARYVTFETVSKEIKPILDDLTRARELLSSFKGVSADRQLSNLGLSPNRLSRLNDAPGRIAYTVPTIAQLKNKRINNNNMQRMGTRVLSLPLYDLPGRISGWTVIKRNEQDYTHTRVPVSKTHAATGLSYLPKQLFGDRRQPVAIVTTNPLAYLQWQITEDRHSRGRTFIYCPPSFKPIYQWQAFQNQELLFWSPAVDAQILSQAIYADAQLYLAGPTRPTLSGMLEFIQTGEGRVPAGKSANQETHWTKYLHHLAQSTPEVFDKLIGGLKLGDFDFQRIYQRCTPVVCQRVDQVLAVKPRFKTVTLGGREIEQRETGWYLRRGNSEEQISNCTFAVNRVLYRKRDDQVIYQGVVRLGGVEKVFTTVGKEFERKPLDWLRHHLIKLGVGMVRFNPSWQVKVFNIATQLHPTELVEGIDRIGWDPAQSCFVFPGFDLDHEARVHLRDEIAIENDLPAAGLTPPVPAVVPTAIERVKSEDGYWSAWLACAVLILRPYLDGRQPNVAFTGPGGLDLFRHFVTALDSHPLPKKSPAYTNPHNWPLHFQINHPADWQYFCGQIDAGLSHIMLHCDQEKARAILLKRGCAVVTAKKLKPEMLDNLSVVETRASLLDFVSYCLKLSKSQQEKVTSWRFVRDAFNQWKLQYGSAILVRGLCHVGTSSYLNTFPKLVQGLIRSGQIQILNTETYSTRAFYEIPGNRIFIPLANLDGILKNAKLGVLTPKEIRTAVLGKYAPGTEVGDRIVETSGLGGPGWAVPRHWLLGEDLPPESPGSLRIVG